MWRTEPVELVLEVRRRVGFCHCRDVAVEEPWVGRREREELVAEVVAVWVAWT